MNSWIDLRKEMPSLKGHRIHVGNIPIETLETELLDLGFVVYKINGANITDEESFFREVVAVFNFPSYFGYNWSAWDDSLGDFLQLAPSRIAILWVDAAKSFYSNAQIFLQAVCDLNNIVSTGAINKQVEVIIVE